MPIDRVSQRQQDQQRVEQLQQAAATLRKVADAADASDDATRSAPEFVEGAAIRKMADTVDFVLTEEGRKFIGRLTWKRVGEANPNLAMQMPEQLRDDIKMAAVVAGASLEAEAQKALEEFLAGRFTPAQKAREGRGEASKKVNLNVRVNAELRRQVEILSNDLLAQDEMTWAPKASQVIVSWFVDRLEEKFVNPARRPTRKPSESAE